MVNLGRGGGRFQPHRREIGQALSAKRLKHNTYSFKALAVRHVEYSKLLLTHNLLYKFTSK